MLVIAGCSSPADRAAEYLSRAQQAYAASDYVRTRLEAQNAVQVDPRNAPARLLLALVAEHDGDIRRMITQLLMAVDSDPANVEARLKLGTIYVIGRRWDKAEVEALELRKLAGDDPRVRLLDARVLINKGDRASAIEQIRRALATEPENIDALMLSAGVAADQNLQDGLAILDAAIPKLAPEPARELREMRVALLNRGQLFRESEQELRALATDFPQQRSYQSQLAGLYVSQRRIDEADELLHRIAAVDPMDQMNRLRYVEFLLRERDAGRAEEVLKGFIAAGPDASALRLALGQLYEESGRVTDAVQTYEAVADSQPRSSHGLAARGRLAALEIRAGNTGGAKRIIDSVLEDSPDDAAAMLLRAGIRMEGGGFADAMADLRTVLRREPENPRALLLLAQAYVETGELSLATDLYRRLLERDASSAEGLVQLAALLANSQQYAEAEALLRQRLESAPDDLLAAGRIVEALLAQKKFDAAETEARRLAALKNNAGVGDFSMGRVLAGRGDFDAAAGAYWRAAAARPGDPLVVEGLALALESSGQARAAVDFLNGELKSNRNQLLAQFLLGAILGRQGDVRAAEGHLETVIRGNPRLAQVYVVLSDMLRDSPAASVGALQRGLAAVPGDRTLSMLLASRLRSSGRHDEAIAVFEKLVEAHPDFELGINNLSSMLLEHRSGDAGSRVRALQLAERLATSENPALLDTLGWAYYHNQEYRRAYSILERVVAKRGDYGPFRYHLGMAYLALGDPESAREQFKAALSRAEPFPGRDATVRELAKLLAVG